MTSGKVLSTVAIAPGYVDQIAFDPGNSRLYCASSVGDISVVQEMPDGTLSLLGMVATPKGTHTLAVDPVTHTVWASTYDSRCSYLQPYLLPLKSRRAGRGQGVPRRRRRRCRCR